MSWIFKTSNTNKENEELNKKLEELTKINQIFLKNNSTLASMQNSFKSIIKEAAPLVESLNQSAPKDCESFDEIVELFEASKALFKKSYTAVEEMNKFVQKINESNDALTNAIKKGNEQIAAITKVISEIENKTKVINDIVFQTKLLSFNASVEAARAGEHGKGFAVVAEEVGNLAQMSGQASKEISAMLSEGIIKVEEITKENQTNADKMINLNSQELDSGKNVINQCKNTFDEIITHSNTIDKKLNAVNVASKTTVSVLDKVHKLFNQIHFQELDAIPNITSEENRLWSRDHIGGNEKHLKNEVNQKDHASHVQPKEVKKRNLKSPIDKATSDRPQIDGPKISRISKGESPVMDSKEKQSVIPSKDDPRFVDI